MSEMELWQSNTSAERIVSLSVWMRQREHHLPTRPGSDTEKMFWPSETNWPCLCHTCLPPNEKCPPTRQCLCHTSLPPNGKHQLPLDFSNPLVKGETREITRMYTRCRLPEHGVRRRKHM